MWMVGPARYSNTAPHGAATLRFHSTVAPEPPCERPVSSLSAATSYRTMVSVLDVLSADNPVFRAYVFYSCVLVLKLLGMVFLIGRQRFAKKVRECFCLQGVPGAVFLQHSAVLLSYGCLCQ